MLCLNSSVLYTVYIFEKHSWTLVSRWRPRFTLTNILEWTQTHPWVWLVSDRCLVTQLTPIPRPFGSAVRVLDTALRSRRSTTESSPRPPPTTSISTFSHHLHSSTRGTESIHRCQWPQPRRASPYLQPVFLLLLLRVALRVLFLRPAPPCAGSVPVAFPPLGERVSLWELDESLWSGEQVRQESCGSRVCLPAPSREETGESDRGVDHHGGDVPVSSHCYSTDAV